MLVSILGFSRTLIAYKWKFNAIYKQYKDDKIANKVLGTDHHDSWWH
jgi:hypothetical protein